MCGKNKCICAFLVEMVLLCLLSACTVKGSDVDVESQQEKDSVEHELSSEPCHREQTIQGSKPLKIQVMNIQAMLRIKRIKIFHLKWQKSIKQYFWGVKILLISI